MQNPTWIIIGLLMLSFLAAAIYGLPLNPLRFRGPVFSDFNFEVLNGCTDANTANAESGFENIVEFSGCVLLPTPCHTLDANYNVRTTEEGQDIVTIELVALPSPADNVCIQVLQARAFEGNFTLNSLNFEVDIVYNGENLERFAAIV